jgi:hypothetical protein
MIWKRNDTKKRAGDCQMSRLGLSIRKQKQKNPKLIILISLLQVPATNERPIISIIRFDEGWG